MVAELEVAVDQADFPTELAVEGDRRVDRDRRRPDAALRPVQGEDAPERWPPDERLVWREPGQEALNPGHQLGRVERLDQVVVGARPQAADLLLDLAFSGEHDDRDVAGGPFLGPDLRRHLVAVELREHDVEEDQVRSLGAPQAEPLRAVGGNDDFVALLLQRVLKQALHVGVIVDDEDLGRHQSPSRPLTPGRRPGRPAPRL